MRPVPGGGRSGDKGVAVEEPKTALPSTGPLRHLGSSSAAGLPRPERAPVNDTQTISNAIPATSRWVLVSGALMACRPPAPTSLGYGRPLHVQMPLGLLPAGPFVRSPGELRQYRSTPRSGSAVRDRVGR